jgi:hypothetical protein
LEFVYPCCPSGGGEIVAQGTPEDIVKVARSYTGQFLKPVLGRRENRKKKGPAGGGMTLSSALCQRHASVLQNIMRQRRLPRGSTR